MGIDLLKIAKEFGTPAYVYDLDGIVERIGVLKKYLPQTKIYYAVKANPNLELLKALKKHLDGLDLSSGGELSQSILAGYSADKFSWAGPGKSETELATAIKSGCGSISIESADDLENILNAAKQTKKQAKVSLRLNPLELIHKFAIKMGGKATQFGVDEEAASELLATILKHKELAFQGFHIYAGTQCLDAQALADNCRNNLALIHKLCTVHKIKPAKINLGGGLGIPYFAGNVGLDLANTVKLISTEITAFKKEFPKTEFIIELGRYIVGEFGWYLTKVLALKESRGRKYVILDGGMHQNLSASGHLGQVIKKNYPIQNLSNASGPTQKYDLAGCLCTPLDILATEIELTTVSKNDVLAIGVSGAYGYTSSPLLFLGHETPKEILVTGNKAKVIRESRDITFFN